MDPKKVLEAFRVDSQVSEVTIQKSSKRNILFLIFLAMIVGLSTGMGSAFAIGLPEMAPTRAPLDEPASKAKSEVKIPDLPRSTAELSPLKPPLDQPIAKESNLSESKKRPDKKTAKKEKQSKKPEKSSHHKKESVEKKKLTTVKVKDSKKAATKGDSTLHKKRSEPQLENTSKSSVDKPKVIEQKPEDIVENRVETNIIVSEEPQQPIVEQKQEKSTPVKKNDVGLTQSKKTPPIVASKESPSKKHQTSTYTKSKRNVVASLRRTTSAKYTNSVGKHEVRNPKTQPGLLPHTAGNELNHVVACFAVICFSIAYLLARRENHPE